MNERWLGPVTLCVGILLLGASPQKRALIARGKYLVNEVAKCGDCHSPRNERGQFIPDQWLHGSPVYFQPTVPLAAWAENATDIAGLPGWTDEGALSLFTTGHHLDGKPPRPPMPEYRLPESDARAMIAYLRSLAHDGQPR